MCALLSLLHSVMTFLLCSHASREWRQMNCVPRPPPPPPRVIGLCGTQHKFARRTKMNLCPKFYAFFQSVKMFSLSHLIITHPPTVMQRKGFRSLKAQRNEFILKRLPWAWYTKWYKIMWVIWPASWIRYLAFYYFLKNARNNRNTK